MKFTMLLSMRVHSAKHKSQSYPATLRPNIIVTKLYRQALAKSYVQNVDAVQTASMTTAVNLIKNMCAQIPNVERNLRYPTMT